MYTNQSKVEAYLKRALTSEEVELFDDTVDSIASFIEGYTGRTWLPYGDEDEELEAEERIFDGNGKKELFIDDFTAIESIKLLDRNGNTIAELSEDTEWKAYPHNSSLKESVRLQNYTFPMGSGTVEITAIWGSGDVPIDVVMVSTALVGNFLSGMGDSTGQYKKESIEGYSYELMDGSTTDEETKGLLGKLDKWKKFSF